MGCKYKLNPYNKNMEWELWGIVLNKVFQFIIFKNNFGGDKCLRVEIWGRPLQ